MKEKLLASRKRSDDSDENEDEVVLQESIDNSTPPGTAYVELLQMVNQDVLPGEALHTRRSFPYNSIYETITGTCFVLSSFVHSRGWQLLTTNN